MNAANQSALTSLRRRWLLAAALYTCSLLVVGGLLRTQMQPAEAARWAALAAAICAYQLWLLWAHLDVHHRPDETALLARLGPGNALTLLRGLACGLLGGFLLAPWPAGLLAWLPALLYTVSGVADYFDGYVARISGHATRLGEILDLEFDALGLLVVVAVAIHFGQWPLWFLPIGLARYLFIFGLWLRRRLSLAVYELPPSASRRAAAGMQMGMLSVVLWPPMPPTLAVLAGLLFAAPFTAVFIRDWLAVSGALDTRAPAYATGRRVVMDVLATRLPVGMRLLATMALVAMLVAVGADSGGYVTALAAIGFGRTAEAAGALFVGVMVIALPFLALGAAGRAAALALMPPVGFTIAAAGFTAASATAAVAVLYIFIFGPGALALWKPEERFFSRRAGEDRAGE